MTAVLSTIRTRSARDVMAWSRTLVHPALRFELDRLPASFRTVAGYHFGWNDEEGRPTRTDSGRGLRSALVLLSAEAVGGIPESVVPAAVAVELVHNAAVLHDDVLAGELVRRGRPAAWSVFGGDAVALTANTMVAHALDVLAALDGPAPHDLVRMLTQVIVDLLVGQATAHEIAVRPKVTIDDCLEVAEHRTAALCGQACALGAVIGGGRPGQVEHLREFGRQFGLALHHVCDLLGASAHATTVGRAAFADITHRRKTLPVVAALTSGTRSGTELAAVYATDRPLFHEEVSRAADLVDQAGGRAWGVTQALERSADAVRHLLAAHARSRPADELIALARMGTST
ncbi:MAG TPA: polyprenyl synthetase family protein [Actinopolymorphaceae bacterium]